mgnify:CR=1 FL=1
MVKLIGTTSPHVVAADFSAKSVVGHESFLQQLDQKLQRSNDRLWQKLLAWGQLLDAVGWCVALDSPMSGLWLSENAERDLLKSGGIPSAWRNLHDKIDVSSINHITEGVLIWARDSGALTGLEPSVPLTLRESQVVSWLREGKTGPEIAIILGCAARTVEKHMANLYRKLGVNNRSAVIFKTSKPTR